MIAFRPVRHGSAPAVRAAVWAGQASRSASGTGRIADPDGVLDRLRRGRSCRSDAVRRAGLAVAGPVLIVREGYPCDLLVPLEMLTHRSLDGARVPSTEGGQQL